MAYECKVCGHEAESRPKLMGHMRSEHKKCSVCGEWCKNDRGLVAHARSHSKGIRSEKGGKPAKAGRKALETAKAGGGALVAVEGIMSCPHCGGHVRLAD